MILHVNTEAIAHNYEVLNDRFDQEVVAVLKGVGCDGVITEALTEVGCETIAGVHPTWLGSICNKYDVDGMMIRPPSRKDIQHLVVDNPTVIHSDEHALEAADKTFSGYEGRHRALLMVDVGDNREGIPPDALPAYVRLCKDLDNVDLQGIAMNPGCDTGNVNSQAVEVMVERAEDMNLDVISGGSTALLSESIPQGVTQIRLGEALLTGRYAVEGDAIEGLRQDTFEVEAKVINDRGTEVILDIGTENTAPESLYDGVAIDRSWSDMSIARAPDLEYGDTVTFQPRYWAVARSHDSSGRTLKYSE